MIFLVAELELTAVERVERAVVAVVVDIWEVEERVR
jgi:hypothetical protein